MVQQQSSILIWRMALQERSTVIHDSYSMGYLLKSGHLTNL